jgi:hypothetical protein
MQIDDSISIQTYGAAPVEKPAPRASPEAFAQALTQARGELAQAAPAGPKAGPAASTPAVRIVRSGDTLSHIVRQEAQVRGVQLSGAQEHRSVLALAQANGISNPNRIFAGQSISLGALHARWDEAGSELWARRGPQRAGATGPAPAAASSPSSQAMLSTKGNGSGSADPHPVLRQTLDRAVARGFIPAPEKQDVYNKILQVANKHRFSPDDFARLTLMESDGMNPQATNQRCHGIIQFCDGPARGAASVGFGSMPKAILNLSVYQQLHLVDNYFDHVGLKKQGSVSLDELYLAVLYPAARTETRSEVPLAISGNQSSYLYEGRNPRASITRNSIVQGLIHNTTERLGALGQTLTNALPNRMQAQRSAQYTAVESADGPQ